jgi:hypothetical protein
MMGRQVGRSGQGAPSASGGRFSGRFSSGAFTPQAQNFGKAGVLGNGGSADLKAQYKNVQPGMLGF